MVRAKDVTERAVDNFTSSVESLLIALSQRSMTEAQRDRLAAVLQTGELDLLRRSTSSPATDTTAAAPSSTRSRSRRAA